MLNLNLFKALLIAMPAFLFPTNSYSEKLVLMHTNDTHSQIDPMADGMGGVARRKVVIDSIRKENPNSLLIDAGDIVQGSLFFNLYKGEVEEKIMNALGYDLRILGNHEFDNGMESLADNLSQANALLLSSNYQLAGTALEGVFLPYALYEIDGKRIAFMPLNVQPKGLIASNNTIGMGYVDIYETADKLAWMLKNIAQADYVVAITHIGYQDDVKLIKKSHDIDLLIGGHSHTLLDPSNDETYPYIIKNADGREVLIAQMDKAGRHLGEITIDLDNLSELPTSKAIAIDSRLDSRKDGSIDSMLSPYREGVDKLNSVPVAKTKRFMDQKGIPLLNFMSDMAMVRGKELDKNVELAIVNKGGLRNSLPKGEVTAGEIITVNPFFNRYVVIEVPGDKLAANFEIMARQQGQGVSENVEVLYDPATGKCEKVMISGKQLDPTKSYHVATIDYLAQGGDYMEPLIGSKEIARSENYIYEDILNYLSKDGKNKVIDGSDTPRMKTHR